jgi:uncharacterized cofD-like protein
LSVLPAAGTGPNVVCVGGGHGLAQALQAASSYAGSLRAVVTVADDGGSSGRLAPALDIPPPGDMRRCMLAMTTDESLWRRLFEYRFQGSDVHGHSLGNLLIAALTDLEGGFGPGLHQAERLLGSHGSVIPVASAHLRLMAESDGHVIAGQAKIGRARAPIQRMWVEPQSTRVAPEAVAALAGADQIVLGPGSLYTSLIATLVVPGLVDAVNAADAALVYVANLITQDGETLGMDLSAHLKALIDLAGLRRPTAIVAESGPVHVAPPLEPVWVSRNAVEAEGYDVVFAELADPTAPWPQHDPRRLGEALERLTN